MKQRDLIKKLEKGGFVFERHGTNQEKRIIIMLNYVLYKMEG